MLPLRSQPRGAQTIFAGSLPCPGCIDALASLFASLASSALAPLGVHKNGYGHADLILVQTSIGIPMRSPTFHPSTLKPHPSTTYSSASGSRQLFTLRHSTYGIRAISYQHIVLEHGHPTTTRPRLGSTQAPDTISCRSPSAAERPAQLRTTKTPTPQPDANILVQHRPRQRVGDTP